MLKVAFTGTQKGMTPTQTAAFEAELMRLSIMFGRDRLILVHGGCDGADDEADVIAAHYGIDRICYPSTHNNLEALKTKLRARDGSMVNFMPPKPPLVRNKLIVNDSKLLLATPRQPTEILRSGTWMTVRYGRKKLGEPAVKILKP